MTRGPLAMCEANPSLCEKFKPYGRHASECVAYQDGYEEALEDAARVAEKEFTGSKRTMPERETGWRIALAIRALKDKAP